MKVVQPRWMCVAEAIVNLFDLLGGLINLLRMAKMKN